MITYNLQLQTLDVRLTDKHYSPTAPNRVLGSTNTEIPHISLYTRDHTKKKT